MQQLSSKSIRTGALILIIGFSDPIINFFSSGLKVSGYTTRGCHYGPEIAGTARETEPDLILLEFNAPNDDDLDLFKQLREAASQTCPILVLTEQVHDRRFQNTDATSLIPMPCDFDTVLAKVNALIGHLNPQLSQPRKGFLYPVNNPPPDLPEEFRS